MFPSDVLPLTSLEIAVRPESAPSTPLESITHELVCRPGESPTAAAFRHFDRFHGSGLSATDQVVVLVDDHAATGLKSAQCERALDEALKVNAALLAERDMLLKAVATEHETAGNLSARIEILEHNNSYYQRRVLALAADVDHLRTESAARLELLTDAYELIGSLEGQLQDAQCAALSAQGQGAD